MGGGHFYGDVVIARYYGNAAYIADFGQRARQPNDDLAGETAATKESAEQTTGTATAGSAEEVAAATKRRWRNWQTH